MRIISTSNNKNFDIVRSGYGNNIVARNTRLSGNGHVFLYFKIQRKYGIWNMGYEISVVYFFRNTMNITSIISMENTTKLAVAVDNSIYEIE